MDSDPDFDPEQPNSEEEEEEVDAEMWDDEENLVRPN